MSPVERFLPLCQQTVDRYLSRFPRFDYLRDDLCGEAQLALVQTLEGDFEYQNLEAFLRFRLMNVVSDYAERQVSLVPPQTRRSRRQRGAPPIKAPQLVREITEPVVENESNELMEEILTCCETEQERQIVGLRSENRTDEEIATILGMSKTCVFMVRKGIAERFEKRDR